MSIAVLAKRWTTAKDMIDGLKAEMLDIENQLLSEVESVEGGSRTTKAEGYKIVVKRPINRTIDGEEWDRVKASIPSDLWPIRVKVEPDAQGCAWLAANAPAYWAIAAKAITEKPGKPGFTIQEATE